MFEWHFTVTKDFGRSWRNLAPKPVSARISGQKKAPIGAWDWETILFVSKNLECGSKSERTESQRILRFAIPMPVGHPIRELFWGLFAFFSKDFEVFQAWKARKVAKEKIKEIRKSKEKGIRVGSPCASHGEVRLDRGTGGVRITLLQLGRDPSKIGSSKESKSLVLNSF